MSMDPTNSSTLFGGTWEPCGQGRVPVAVGSNGTTNYGNAGLTGGFDYSTHAHDASTTGSTALTISQIPAHNHAYTSGGTSINVNTTNSLPTTPVGIGFAHITDGTGWWSPTNKNTSSIAYTGGSQGHTHSIPASSNATVDNRMSFFTCYMWKRIG